MLVYCAHIKMENKKIKPGTSVVDLEIQKGRGSTTGEQNALENFWATKLTSSHMNVFMTHVIITCISPEQSNTRPSQTSGDQ